MDVHQGPTRTQAKGYDHVTVRALNSHPTAILTVHSH